MTLNLARLKEIDAANPLWRVGEVYPHVVVPAAPHDSCVADADSDEMAALIVELRNSLPAIIARLERLDVAEKLIAVIVRDGVLKPDTRKILCAWLKGV